MRLFTTELEISIDLKYYSEINIPSDYFACLKLNNIKIGLHLEKQNVIF